MPAKRRNIGARFAVYSLMSMHCPVATPRRGALLAKALAAGALSLAILGEAHAGVVYDFEESAENWGFTQTVRGSETKPSAERASHGKSSLKCDAVFPGQTEVSVRLDRANWSDSAEVSVNVFVPADAPPTTQALLFVKDRDNLWYQHLHADYLRPGAWNHICASLGADGKLWEPRGHFQPWSGGSARGLLEFGVRVFCKKDKFRGAVFLDEVTLWPPGNGKPDQARTGGANVNGFIRNLRVNTVNIGQNEKFEITLGLQKDYANPYLPDEIAVDAQLISPTGRRVTVPGFFYQDYMRENGRTEEKFTPVGRSAWKVRFAPDEIGRYYYRIVAKDKTTCAETAEMSFVCVPSANRGFVRVAKGAKDEPTRYFEFTNGDFFFPIGHNIRSPFDERYATAPWANLQPRRNLGSYAYDRYFERMHANGENFTEVWMASWWVGLEWKSNAPGYHGVGQYNALHAWKLDRLMDKAREQGIYVLLVLNNHGKFSSWLNQEWGSNPFNKVNGGPFELPDEFFTDPRGRTAFKNLLRYLVARWGYSTQVFGWKLFSEINLTGSGRDFHRTPEMREWHREMAAYLKEIDPWKHPITTHYSGDYRVQDPAMISIPELDFSTIDAYHGSQSSLRIVELINETCQFNEPFNKPVIITEFGGSAMGMKASVLRSELHNGLWASAASPSASTPLLWWWMFIDENNLYEMFKPVAEFVKGEDRRGEQMKLASDGVELMGTSADRIGVQPLLGPRGARVWIYDRDFVMGSMAEEDALLRGGLKLKVNRLDDGLYEIETWDTWKGVPTSTRRQAAKEGVLEFDLPAFRKDIAVKIKPANDKVTP